MVMAALATSAHLSAPDPEPRSQPSTEMSNSHTAARSQSLPGLRQGAEAGAGYGGRVWVWLDAPAQGEPPEQAGRGEIRGRAERW